MNLLSNFCQQTGKKLENGYKVRKRKKGPPMNPATAPPQEFLLLFRYNLFIGVDEMRVKKYHRYCVG